MLYQGAAPQGFAVPCRCTTPPNLTQLHHAIATPNSTFLNNASPLLYFSVAALCFSVAAPCFAKTRRNTTGLCSSLPYPNGATHLHTTTVHHTANTGLYFTPPLHHRARRIGTLLYQTVTPQDIRLLHHAIPQQHFAMLNDTAPLLHKA